MQACQEGDTSFDVLEVQFRNIDGRIIRSLDVYKILAIPIERRKPQVDHVNAAMKNLGWEKKDKLRFHKRVAHVDS